MSEKNQETLNDVVIEATDHSLIQLFDRYSFKTYAHIIDGEEILLYPDIDDGSNVFYHNLIPTGFVVLRRTEPNKFVVITTTLSEHRDYGEPIVVINPTLRERQSEYEL